MNMYETIKLVGEGAYGIVMKGMNRNTNEIVAIKKFKMEKKSDSSSTLKVTEREVSLLKTLKHDNIVELKDSFLKRGRQYLVFEYLEKNLLEVLESSRSGLDSETLRWCMYQICSALAFCHKKNVVHRDVKPENLLVNPETMTVKLCDFGFSRHLDEVDSSPLTDYVATRWYRSPELLVGHPNYGKEVDMWAMGCIMGELIDGRPIFPGESEVDQLIVIQKMMGPLTSSQESVLKTNPQFAGLNLFNVRVTQNIHKRYADKASVEAINFMSKLLRMDPNSRMDAEEALRDPYFRVYNSTISFPSAVKVTRKHLNRKQIDMPQQQSRLSTKCLGELDTMTFTKPMKSTMLTVPVASLAISQNKNVLGRWAPVNLPQQPRTSLLPSIHREKRGNPVVSSSNASMRSTHAYTTKINNISFIA
eukprot:TRINITY_DN95630_c1_g1_i1.p1 TRINITY_DN95630_c1_g1~~TRINITY_DN95630_c1_g1_i1.p1  ORF type:complete len:419 (-),score=35.87 TRINITY_DN95630_c1_g1_i1:241-1497(-)